MRRIIFVIYAGASALDVAGPSEVFAGANRRARQSLYSLEVTSVGGGAVATCSGVVLHSKDLLTIPPEANDTVLVAGGFESAVVPAMQDRRLLDWLRGSYGRTERISSVCSGSFVLGEAGLLEARRAATHWMATRRMARLYPKTTVDTKAIYVVDRGIWTSAGASTGIDMALAMVEQDHGPKLANDIAAELVLYVRRPGFQSQFSDSLVIQTQATDPMHPVVTWVRKNLRTADVASMARGTSLSVRTLHRRCLEHAGATPRRLIDRLRLDHARMLLATGRLTAKRLAVHCGFGTAANMKRIFMRELGISPPDYRLLHSRLQ